MDGVRQDVGHLQVWGCVAYVYIPKKKGGSKLSNRGQKGRLIGIESRGLYRILILETGLIIRSRNVIFEEGLGHHTLMPEGEYLEDDLTPAIESAPPHTDPTPTESAPTPEPVP